MYLLTATFCTAKEPSPETFNELIDSLYQAGFETSTNEDGTEVQATQTVGLRVRNGIFANRMLNQWLNAIKPTPYYLDQSFAETKSS